MKPELNILMLEDNIDDVEMVRRALHEGGFAIRTTCVKNQWEFLDALETTSPDVILSDHAIPAFSGFEAMAMAKQKYPEVPFIFVTGLPEELSEIAAFERGAVDYVPKSRMTRLAPVIKRALDEAAERAERYQQETTLRESEARFRALLDGVQDYAICMLDPQGCVNSWNSGAEWIEGFTSEEILGQHLARLYPVESVATGRPAHALAHSVAHGRFEEECLLARKDGCPYWAHLVLTAVHDRGGSLQGFALVLHDITLRKLAEVEREELLARLEGALTDVKILSGMLPLCAACKKVRDAGGEWQALEAFLRDHSEAMVTHEFCPECARLIQPAAGSLL
jgi:PAS domain S-box-containing protein